MIELGTETHHWAMGKDSQSSKVKTVIVSVPAQSKSKSAMPLTLVRWS